MYIVDRCMPHVLTKLIGTFHQIKDNGQRICKSLLYNYVKIILLKYNFSSFEEQLLLIETYMNLPLHFDKYSTTLQNTD